ncbi:MAG: crossover junction endodeoxyribonuclease RuvC [Brevinematales bacterium]|nr:crossover junction endodeoxyribonuclease RuvC [Brevinematales bacterium]
MIVLGIDPGIERMGYAIMNDVKVISSGLIATKKTSLNQERLYDIFNDLKALVENFKPELIATETLFFSKNTKTASTISEVRGIIKLISAIFKIEYIELSPLQIKMSLTGYGKADKKQIEKSIQMILNLKELPKPDDVIDAMAIAICGINKYKFNLKLKGERKNESEE